MKAWHFSLIFWVIFALATITSIIFVLIYSSKRYFNMKKCKTCGLITQITNIGMLISSICLLILAL